MKISPINLCTNFYGSISNIPAKKNVETNREIKSLSNITPDFNIKVPQNYKKIRTDKLPNNLTLHKYKTANGYDISILPKEDSPACISVTFDVGSANEPKNLKGISHFIEHMLFNGTKNNNPYKKLNAGDFDKEVRKLGGDYNGLTSRFFTTYYINISIFKENDLEEGIKLLATIVENPEFSEEMIEKEKKVVCSEICMGNDNPSETAGDKNIKTLFNLDLPDDTSLIVGSVKNIENLTKKDVLDYYNKYYTPQNAHIVITGDVEPNEIMKIISENFVKKHGISEAKYYEKYTPINKTIRNDIYSSQTEDAVAFLGFSGPKYSNYKESLILDIAILYLSSAEGELIKKMNDYNAFCSLFTRRLSNNPDDNLLIDVSVTSTEKNNEQALKSLIDTIKSVKPISKEKLDSIIRNMKDNIENVEFNSAELNHNLIELKSNSELDNFLKINKILSSITPDDVNNVIKKYFDFSKCAITVLHPDKKKSLSFNGKVRKPVNENKISSSTLKNNINIGFYQTLSNERIVNGNFIAELPYNKKPGVDNVLNMIYDMGTKNLSKYEFEKLLEKENIGISCSSTLKGLSFTLIGDKKNYKNGLNYLEELIYNPRITEENLKKAKEKIKDALENVKMSASKLYDEEFLPKYNDKFYTNKELLKNVESITLEDVKDFHNYLINNSKCNVSANIPQNDSDETKNNIIEKFNNFKEVKPNKNYPILQYYKDVTKPTVLTKAENDKQTDILVTYLFKYKDDIKNNVVMDLFRNILNGSSIGLYEVLREQEKLGYSVGSEYDILGDLGQLHLNILTTTDDKENEIQTYENIKRSIEGFRHQIKEIAEGKFTNEDFENAKLALKADLLSNETSRNKVSAIQNGLNSKYGINYYNKSYGIVDGITKEDIINFAKSIASIPPVYSITASKDTLEANKEYLKSLQN